MIATSIASSAVGALCGPSVARGARAACLAGSDRRMVAGAATGRAPSLQIRARGADSAAPRGVTQPSGRRSALQAQHQPVRRSVAAAAGGEGAGAKKSVIFVCLGNICRSPTAEAMFNAVVEKAGVVDEFDIDSCGTGGGNPSWYMPGGWSYHEGDDADPRMTATAASRGVRLTSKSRPLRPEDFERFDYVVGMDDNNIKAIMTAAQSWSQTSDLPAGYESKVKKMCDFCRDPANSSVTEVPDPYYGGPEGFERVLDLLEDACEGLLEDMSKSK